MLPVDTHGPLSTIGVLSSTEIDIDQSKFGKSNRTNEPRLLQSRSKTASFYVSSVPAERAKAVAAKSGYDIKVGVPIFELLI